jgi:hypothetical protein
LGFGYLRVIGGDELSPRPKFILIKYFTKGLKMTLKTQLNTTQRDVEKVIKRKNATVEAETLDELSDDYMLDLVNRATGAIYY